MIYKCVSLTWTFPVNCRPTQPIPRDPSHLSLSQPHTVCVILSQSITLHPCAQSQKWDVSLILHVLPVIKLFLIISFPSTSPPTSRTTDLSQLPVSLVAVRASQLVSSHSSLSQGGSAAHKSMLSAPHQNCLMTFYLSQEKNEKNYFKEKRERPSWSGPCPHIEFTPTTLPSLSAFQPGCSFSSWNVLISLDSCPLPTLFPLKRRVSPTPNPCPHSTYLCWSTQTSFLHGTLSFTLHPVLLVYPQIQMYFTPF